MPIRRSTTNQRNSDAYSYNQPTHTQLMQVRLKGYKWNNAASCLRPRHPYGVCIYIQVRFHVRSLTAFINQDNTMGHSSKHDKSKRHSRKGTSDDKRPSSSIAQLQALIANVEERQRSLARQHDEYRHLMEQAPGLQERLENSEQTLALLSSTSLAAQQARRVVSMSSD